MAKCNQLTSLPTIQQSVGRSVINTLFNSTRTLSSLFPAGTLALSPERQSARMSEIKNVRLTWMALNTFKRNCLTPLHFKGLMCQAYYGTIYARSVS